MKKVSIIVPAYNVEKYIDRCLNSLVKQTLNEIEIIIINDGSTDNTLKIIKDYKKKYPNKIIYFDNKNHGIGYTRNYGIKKATGQYIGFIDSDDWVDETMYEKLYNKAIKEKLDLVLCNFHKIIEKKELKEIDAKFNLENFNNTTLKDKPDLLLKVNLAPWNKLYKRSLFNKEIKFPENIKYEDAIVVIKAMGESNNIGIFNEKLNYYLVRSKSETTIMDERAFDIFKVTDMMVKYLKSKSYYSEIEEYVEAYTIRNLFRYTLQQKNQKNKNLKNKFIDEAFNYLTKEFPNWKNNKIWKKRNVIKRLLESNKLFTKIYCNL